MLGMMMAMTLSSFQFFAYVPKFVFATLLVAQVYA
jgi:hypothetical protein